MASPSMFAFLDGFDYILHSSPLSKSGVALLSRNVIPSMIRSIYVGTRQEFCSSVFER